jgi:hypothetical protein
VEDPQAIANELNRHFSSVGSKTVSSLHMQEDIRAELKSLWSFEESTFGLRPVGGVSEIQTTLESTKANWSVGAIGIPARLLKTAASIIIARPLTHIINLSF